MTHFFLGIDVGTGSARAGIFDRAGAMLGMGVEPIQLFRPVDDFVEQSSDDIWRACGVAVRAALTQAGLEPSQISGIGFDATCSMVVLGHDDQPVTVSPTGSDAQNVLVWMDHRAIPQSQRINSAGHDVLRYVGGSVSPEMQAPKLLWLKEHLPETWTRARRFLDLPDFLTYRATGNDVRSVCTTTCKWTYLAHEQGWQDSFFREVGLADLVDEAYARIGNQVGRVGELAGKLTAQAAAELGLVAGIPVAVSLIDAHAGGLGVLGYAGDDGVINDELLEERVALIGGTSTCHMAVTREPKFVPGVWGPYFSAMVPELWLTEGGQSATGALIDHVVASHARGPELEAEARQRGTTVHALLNERLDVLAQQVPFPAELTCDMHVYPDHHGNRSPRADASLRGMVSGLRLTDSLDSLAVLYLATIQAVALGTRHIVDVMNEHGHRINTLVATGGGTKNPVFLREHADATGCRIVLPKEQEAVLLGAAIIGAVACGAFGTVTAAMGEMSGAGRVIEPAVGPVAEYHHRKYQVYLRMYEDQRAYAKLMRGGEVTP